MRLLLTVVLGVLLVTYGWGWMLRVPDGQMDTPAYSKYYWQEVKDLASFSWDEARKVVEFSKRPIPRPKDMEF